jgi:Ni,Fe-hydrogenase III small subunit/ferredoxin
VSPWVLRGLRNGVVTTRWPARPDRYASEWRGPATVRDPAGPGRDDLAALCPTGAISSPTGGPLHLDQGRCILCGNCVARRPDVFGWSAGPAAAALTREGLVVPAVPETDGNLAAIRNGLRARTAALRRSVHLRHVDAGSDGAVEQEIQALLNPVYDVHRLGIFFAASPRHADVLLVTGAGARGMLAPLRRTYDGMPDPKIVIAVGTDAVSGGLVSPSYATAGGVAAAVPVDVWLPGSPPSPFGILHALLLALGRLATGPQRAGRQRDTQQRDTQQRDTQQCNPGEGQ